MTLGDFYRLFCTRTCSLCKSDLGTYVHLSTFTRVCAICKEENFRNWGCYRLCDLKLAVRVLHLSRRSRNHLEIYNGRGMYASVHDTSERKFVGLGQAINQYRYDHSSLRDGGIPILDVRPPGNLLNRLYQDAMEYDTICPFPSYDKRTGEVRPSMKCAGCAFVIQRREEGDLGWPGQFDRGYQRGNNEIINEWSEEGFLKHFAWCESAQRLWEKSKGGKGDTWKIHPNGVFESRWILSTS